MQDAKACFEVQSDAYTPELPENTMAAHVPHLQQIAACCDHALPTSINRQQVNWVTPVNKLDNLDKDLITYTILYHC